jgi:hypothetical protein
LTTPDICSDADFRFLVSQYIPALNVKRRRNQSGVGAATHQPLLSSNTDPEIAKAPNSTPSLKCAFGESGFTEE